jgi:rod shape-determining protein MreD
VKPALGLLVFGALAAVLQGAATAVVPARWFPDLGFLLVIAIALRWRSPVGGLLLAALFGYAADLLSGSLLGQHALLRVLCFGAARFASRHLNLLSPLPQMTFVTGLTLANVLLLSALSSFFIAAPVTGSASASALLSHALVNALCAPIVSHLVGRLVTRLSDEESSRRLLRLEPRSWTP